VTDAEATLALAHALRTPLTSLALGLGLVASRVLERDGGLGLFLVREMVEAHGGDIAVRSEPGRGSRFIVRLPLE
jgi:nitrogen-specific signal transduction histidine kinase